jgi:fumarate hydratase subunit beta
LKLKRLKTPLKPEDVEVLRAGDLVTIDGTIVTARDRVYARIIAGEKPPIDLRGGVVYHCGPIVKRTDRGWNVISAGPTTSARLDSMQVEFVRRTGAKVLIGKGGVGKDVVENLAKLGCVYLAFTGGAGALAASQVEGVENVFWEELGLEAIWVLRVRNFGPMVVAVDAHGENLFNRISKI